MKLATFIGRNDAPAIGVVDRARGAVLDLRTASRALGQPANGAFADMLALIDAGPAGLEAARRLAAAWPGEAEIPLAGLRLLSPLPLPRQMRDCLVFEEHLKNGMAQREKRTGVKGSIPDVWYRQPIYYKCNRFSVAGPEAEVVWPKYSEVMDFELELACVIGRTAKDIVRERALEHIFGFTIFNDFSARDAQFAEMEGRLGSARPRARTSTAATCSVLGSSPATRSATRTRSKWKRVSTASAGAAAIPAPCTTSFPTFSPTFRTARPCTPARSSARGRSAPAAATRWGAISSPATWWNWRSRRSACCGTGWRGSEQRLRPHPNRRR
jgi:2-keto-4-pentenoate hydratase/2-oxohepta-3-ene-1,7-dioic acid hydratase in catechol pathway